MTKSVIHTDNAPAAIGTYNQAIKAGSTVYLSGQIPLVPASMEMVSDDFAEQAHQVFKNLCAVCKAAGGDINDMVKVNIFLIDLSHFATVNEIMAQYFNQQCPNQAIAKISTCSGGLYQMRHANGSTSKKQSRA